MICRSVRTRRRTRRFRWSLTGRRIIISPHAGKPGSGKTQFVKDLLAQIRRQSEYKVNFIFFDYAKGDVADDADFVAATRAEVVRVPEESLPVNPFSRVNVNSETAVKVAAQEFADLIRHARKTSGDDSGTTALRCDFALAAN